MDGSQLEEGNAVDKFIHELDKCRLTLEERRKREFPNKLKVIAELKEQLMKCYEVEFNFEKALCV